MFWFLLAFRQYTTLNGRASRKEFWYFLLFSLLLSALAMSLDTALGTHLHPRGGPGLASAGLHLALLAPTLSVSIRRLHDTGRSGYWLLLALLPLPGGLLLLAYLIEAGETDPNAYGVNPLTLDAYMAHARGSGAPSSSDTPDQGASGHPASREGSSLPA